MVIINDTFIIFENFLKIKSTKLIMNKNNPRSFKSLGSTCNVLSSLLTIILCLPLPIVFFFLQKKMTSLFSIYNSYTEYMGGKMPLEKLSKKLRNTRIGLFVFAFIWLIITLLVYMNTNLSKMENVLGNSIVILPIVLTMPCIILCAKVNRSVNINLRLKSK